MLCLLLATTTARICLGQEPGISSILPGISQLGKGWSSNRVALLVDPLSSPSEVADPQDVRDPEASLRKRRETLAKGNLVAHGFVRYYRGNRPYGVFASRFKTQAGLEESWKRSLKESEPTVVIANGIGESAFLYKSQGMHNDVCFRRGNYLITVEWETVQEDWPPDERRLNYAPGVSDEFYVKRPSKTPWRVCIIYNKNWERSGKFNVGDYEVISKEMKE